MGLNLLGGGGVKPINPNNSVKFNSYGFQKARDTKIRGGGAGFLNKVSNTKFNKRLSGKAKFKTKEGYMTSGEARKHISGLAKKHSSTGLSGKKIKEEFKKIGMKYQDAEALDRAATHPWAKPENTGPDEKALRARIKASITSSQMAAGKKNVGLAAGLSTRRTKGEKESIKKATTENGFQIDHKALDIENEHDDAKVGVNIKNKQVGASAIKATQGEVAASVVAGTGVIKKQQEEKNTTIDKFTEEREQQLEAEREKRRRIAAGEEVEEEEFYKTVA